MLFYLFIVIPLLFISINASSHDKHSSKIDDVTFKQVMQGLLAESKTITEGIILEDYLMIEKAASRIAKHPKPAMSQRKKLMKSLGAEISKFKSFDSIVHGGAVIIEQAAKNKDMPRVLAEYQKMIDGCQSCHHIYKKRLSRVLQ
jgi:cytochrome c556